MKTLINFPFPVFLAKEKKWHIAECPILGLATQGKTEKEAKEMIEDLIKEYLRDPDTPKSKIREIASSSLSYIPIKIPSEILYGKVKTVAAK